MKAEIASLIVAALAAGGLTLSGVETIGPGWDAYMRKLNLEISSYAGAVVTKAAGLTARDVEEHEPGPTYALAVLDGMIIGLDEDGYVTWVDEIFAGSDFPALTGLSVDDPCAGRRLSQPEITVGLCVARAFECHEDLFQMLSEVNISDLSQPRAILKGRVIVEVGSGNYPRKIDRLHQVLIQAPHLDICPERVDLRFDRQVIIEYSQVRNRARKEV